MLLVGASLPADAFFPCENQPVVRCNRRVDLSQEFAEQHKASHAAKRCEVHDVVCGLLGTSYYKLLQAFFRQVLCVAKIAYTSPRSVKVFLELFAAEGHKK
jgi:hypothetical protein